MSLSFIISDQQCHSQPLPQTSPLHLRLVMYSVNSIPYALSLTSQCESWYSILECLDKTRCWVGDSIFGIGNAWKVRWTMINMYFIFNRSVSMSSLTDSEADFSIISSTTNQWLSSLCVASCCRCKHNFSCLFACVILMLIICQSAHLCIGNCTLFYLPDISTCT